MDRGTVLYLHQIYYNIFKRMNIILPLMERGVTLILYTNTLKYLVKYYCKDLLSRKVMTLRTGFYDILGKNGGLFKLSSCPPLPGCHLGQEFTHLFFFTQVAPFFFYLAV